MIDEDEIAKVNIYLSKLAKTIQTQAVFSLFNKKYVNKQRIDDILCCIDINFPVKIKKFQKEHGNLVGKIKSIKLYQQLINNIKIRSFFGQSNYAINYIQAVELINKIQNSFKNDLAYIANVHPEIK